MQPSNDSGEFFGPKSVSRSTDARQSGMTSPHRAFERREGRRFELDWRIEIKGRDDKDEKSVAVGILKNLSSGGALLYLKESPEPSAKLNILIKIPFKNENWMQYRAECVRVERHRSKFRVAVKFSGSRPQFWIVTADSNSSGVYPGKII